MNTKIISIPDYVSNKAQAREYVLNIGRNSALIDARDYSRLDSITDRIKELRK